jgi:hypothetical protein
MWTEALKSSRKKRYKFESCKLSKDRVLLLFLLSQSDRDTAKAQQNIHTSMTAEPPPKEDAAQPTPPKVDNSKKSWGTATRRTADVRGWGTAPRRTEDGGPVNPWNSSKRTKQEKKVPAVTTEETQKDKATKK